MTSATDSAERSGSRLAILAGTWPAMRARECRAGALATLLSLFLHRPASRLQSVTSRPVSRGPLPRKQVQLEAGQSCLLSRRMAPGGLGDGLTTFDPPPPPGRRIKAGGKQPICGCLACGCVLAARMARCGVCNVSRLTDGQLP